MTSIRLAAATGGSWCSGKPPRPVFCGTEGVIFAVKFKLNAFPAELAVVAWVTRANCKLNSTARFGELTFGKL